MPNDFLRAAERYGLMRSIDRWVVRECIQHPGGPAAAVPRPALHLLDQPLAGLARRRELPRLPGGGDRRLRRASGKLCFEITETAAIENLPQARKLLQRLSARGIRFALDDFGTGMASYSYLRDLPVHYLKIDARFIKDIVTDPLDRAMVESIHQVSEVMGIQTVAEGVPSHAAIEQLRSPRRRLRPGQLDQPAAAADGCVLGRRAGQTAGPGRSMPTGQASRWNASDSRDLDCELLARETVRWRSVTRRDVLAPRNEAPPCRSCRL